MKDLEEQRICVKFCFKLGKTFTETFQMLQQAYGEDCLSCTQYHKWYHRFKSGRTSTKDDPKSGRPSMSMDDDHIKKVLAAVHQNRCLTVGEVAEEVGICKSLCHLILTDKLKMGHVAAKFVPRLLTCIKREPCHCQSGAVWSFECWWKLSEKCHNRWWNWGVRLLFWNKSSVIAVDGKIVTMTKKSMSESL